MEGNDFFWDTFTTAFVETAVTSRDADGLIELISNRAEEICTRLPAQSEEVVLSVTERIAERVYTIHASTLDLGKLVAFSSKLEDSLRTVFETRSIRGFSASIQEEASQLFVSPSSPSDSPHPESDSPKNAPPFMRGPLRRSFFIKPRKKQLSRPAQSPLITQTREQLLANSHLNDRHPVQREILEKILHDMVDDHILTGYIHEPARVGKTAIYADFLRHYFHYLRDKLQLQKRVYLVVPSTVLMAQMPDDIQKFFPEISIGAYYGKEKNLDADVVLITYHSFNKLVEAATIQPEETGCIILDEAHNALSDWRRDIIDRFSESIRLGGTATSELGDERTVESLLKYQYHRMSIVQAIEYGLVAPYKVIYVQTDTDLSGVKMAGGDYVEGELSKRIDNKDRNALVVELHRQCFLGRKAIAYCGTVGHSKSLRDDCLLAEMSAISIDSSSEYDDEDLVAFKRGDYMIATNPLKLTEGYDDVMVEVIYCVRPSFSPRVVGQSRPRGQTLRTGKVCSYIVEFVDPTEGNFPLTYEEFVLRDHQKTTGDDTFSLDQLRQLMHDKISARGETIEIPHEIGGHLVGSNPASIKMIFALRESDRREKLIRAGITPGEPPDDWPSYTEFETFAGMKKSWMSNRVFRILQQAGKKFSHHVKKYKGRFATREYIDPYVLGIVCDFYASKNPGWRKPEESFSRQRVTRGALDSLNGGPKEKNKQIYPITFLELVDLIRCDISLLRAYGPEYWTEKNISFSLYTESCDIISDTEGLADFIRQKKAQEISIDDILVSLQCEKITLVPKIAELLKKHTLSLERLKNGYILMDHWLMIADEVKI